MEAQTKECSKCRQTKPLTAFGKLARGRDGYNPSCKSCNKRTPRIIYRVINGEKECTVCHSMKSLADFSPKQRGVGGVASRCNACAAKATGAWRNLPGNLERGKHATQQWLEKPENRVRNRQNTQEAEVRRMQNPLYREKMRQRVTKYRSLKKGLPQIDVVNLDVLYKRDKGICSLCFTHVKRSEASQDHIIPVSKVGSEESYRNSALAHLDCNRRKNNRAVLQQMWLL